MRRSVEQTVIEYRRPPPRPRRRRWPWLVLALLIFLGVVAFWRAETEPTPALRLHRLLGAHVTLPGKPPQLAWPGEGEAAVAVEGLGSLGAVRAQKPVPIASVAKVMTAYITLREHPLAPRDQGFSIRISAADVAEEHERLALDESTVEVKKGELLSERQALEALMLPSANNVAALLAVRDAGTITAFVAEMNRTARELGMASTTYTDPSGYEEGTVSTATDQLKLARAAMADPEFARIVDLPGARLPVVGRVVNYNELVGRDGFVGIKTGSDEAAGGCLLFARHVTVAGHTLTVVGAVLGQRQGELVDAALASADRLADSVAAAIGVKTALPAGTPVLVAKNASGSRVVATTAQPVREVGWAGQVLPIRASVLAPTKSLDEGQLVARIAVDGPRVGHALVRAAAALGPPSLGWRLAHPF